MILEARFPRVSFGEVFLHVRFPDPHDNDEQDDFDKVSIVYSLIFSHELYLGSLVTRIFCVSAVKSGLSEITCNPAFGAVATQRCTCNTAIASIALGCCIS